MQQSHVKPIVPLSLLKRFDVSGPRYTSYPTADRFVEAFDAATYGNWLGKRHLTPRPISLYFHIPFCKSICYYCACNKVITKDHGRSARYVDYLAKEMALTTSHMRGTRRVVQMHFGGGTPNFLNREELVALVGAIRDNFELDARGEFSIELDPRSVWDGAIALLAELGFNRVSLGVQDFDPVVQKAVNRIQSEEQTLGVMNAAREAGFRSVNVDLIYGLPKQNVIGFNRTLERVIEAAPDRIALYNYAHLPTVFKPQRRIAEEDLPSADAKLQLLSLAIRRMTEAGYTYIGMDHFAKPGDELAVAQRQGRLHRNFQGYSTHAESDLLAFGISAISQVGPTYSQNVKTLDEYYDRLDRGMLPAMRGIEMTADDLLRRSIIQALMCHFEVPIESIEVAHLIDFRKYFAQELQDLMSLRDAGLVHIDNQYLSVTQIGRFFIRNICMVFDRYLREGRERARYSKAV